MMEVKPINVIAALMAAIMLLGIVTWFIPADKVVEDVVIYNDPDHNPITDAPRSPRWKTVRKEYLSAYPRCAACGSKEQLEVHHVLSFSDNPKLELDISNLTTLCRKHHFEIGHDPDGNTHPRKPDWRYSNPLIRTDIQRYRRLNQKPMMKQVLAL